MADLLIGCREKIKRAGENIQNLNSEITAFLGGDPKPYQIVRRHQKNGREYAFIALGEPIAPPRFSVLAGEIIHHLRSSLDHLLCALVIRNGGTPTTLHQFPIYTSAKKFEKACARGLIKGISPTAEEIIRSIQPYTTQAPHDTPLHIIHQCDNLDKHQLLFVVCTVAQIGKEIRVVKANQPIVLTGMSPPSPRKISKDGVVVFSLDLGSFDPQFEAEADFVVQVAFEEMGRSQLIPVTEALTRLLGSVETTLNLFSAEF